MTDKHLQDAAPRPAGKLRTGIFGGSFNPIHVGHVALARELLRQKGLDEVWFVVSPLNPFKAVATDLLSDELRLAMTRRALQGEAGMVASDYEFHLSKPSYTWHTLQCLTRDYPDRDFVLVIGADNWAAFDRWANTDYILSHHEIVVYPRQGYAVDAAQMPQGVTLLDMPLYEVSSTEVRQRVAEGRPVKGLVPSSVEEMVCQCYAQADGQQGQRGR